MICDTKIICRFSNSWSCSLRVRSAARSSGNVRSAQAIVRGCGERQLMLTPGPKVVAYGFCGKWTGSRTARGFEKRQIIFVSQIIVRRGRPQPDEGPMLSRDHGWHDDSHAKKLSPDWSGRPRWRRPWRSRSRPHTSVALSCGFVVVTVVMPPVRLCRIPPAPQHGLVHR